MDFLRIEYNKAWRERVIFDKLRKDFIIEQ